MPMTIPVPRVRRVGRTPHLRLSDVDRHDPGAGRGAARGRPGPRLRPAARVPAARHRARQHLAAAAGADTAERATTWWASALRFLGCTGHAFEVAALFGDEIELRDRSLRADAANPADMLRLMVSHAGPGLSGLPRLRSVIATVATGRKAVEYNFRTACEVADALAARLGLDPAASGPRWPPASNAGTAAASRTESRAPRSPARCGSRSSPRSSRSLPGSRASRPRWRSSAPDAAAPTIPS